MHCRESDFCLHWWESKKKKIDFFFMLLVQLAQRLIFGNIDAAYMV